jgi:hypothetical protein
MCGEKITRRTIDVEKLVFLIVVDGISIVLGQNDVLGGHCLWKNKTGSSMFFPMKQHREFGAIENITICHYHHQEPQHRTNCC